MDMTPEEQRVLKETKAALDAGADPFGDNDPLEATDEASNTDAATTAATTDNAAGADDDAGTGDDTGAAVDDDGTGAENPPAGEGKTDEAPEKGGAKSGDDKQQAAELDAEELEDIADPLGLRTAAPTRFQTEVPADIKEQRKTLRAEKAGALKKLMDGEIDADAYAAEEDRISEALDALNRQEFRAETLQEVNRQNDEGYTQRVIKSLMKRTKSEIDYAKDAKAATQFDQALGMLGADPDNAGLDFAELADMAHRTVAALRGVQVKQPAQQQTQQTNNEPPDRRPKVGNHVTLRDVPAAAQSNTGGSIEEQMSRLSGVEFEAAFAKLSPQQKARLLDEA